MYLTSILEVLYLQIGLHTGNAVVWYANKRIRHSGHIIFRYRIDVTIHKQCYTLQITSIIKINGLSRNGLWDLHSPNGRQMRAFRAVQGLVWWSLMDPVTMVVLTNGHQVRCILWVQLAIFYKGINMQACSFYMFSNPCCTQSLVVSCKYWVVPLISTRISPDIHEKFLTWMTSWRPKRGCHSIHRDRQTSPDSTSMFGW